MYIITIINKKYNILTLEYEDIIGIYVGELCFGLYKLGMIVRSGEGDNRLLYIAMLSSEYFRINISLSSISKKLA
ncbi:hypothetical protein OAS95_01345 [Pelagibacteraceae bacterium]|nr:hypothetical protein [Pelagibacteraceae bacterium]